MQKSNLSIAFLGATGAVGSATLNQLLTFENIDRLLLFGRRKVEGLDQPFIEQQIINIFDPSTYNFNNVNTAICTLGVGEPSKTSKEDFIKIDKQAVLDFAIVCKKAGVQHFQLLSSVGIDSSSRNFFLRTKGELVDELRQLQFERLSIFQPSMIITPQNRYGFSQAVVLKVWPVLSTLLIGSLNKYKGIKVSILGKAIANNTLINKTGFEQLFWSDFQKLTT